MPTKDGVVSAASAVTQLLQSWSEGDGQALDRLVPLVYDELRQLARHHLAEERKGHTLQRTALVHEAFMRLAKQRSVHWTSRSQFFGWVSTLMRRILIDHARSRATAKRGHGEAVQSLDALQDDFGEWPAGGSDQQLVALLQLDVALTRMEKLDTRQAQVVELRFFGGLSVEETAESLQVSTATVKREWATARAWLLRELGWAGSGLA